MVTAPDSTPKRHLLSLPQELLDIILDFAYPAEDEKRFVCDASFEEEEKERRRRNPDTFAPKDFIHKVNQWMVSKAFFESATRAWVANQHFRGYAFSGPYSPPFAHVHHSTRTEPGSILVRYCTKLSVSYIRDCSEFDGLPSLKYLTLGVDSRTFEPSEPAFAWEVALSREQLQTIARETGLSELPKLKQIKLGGEMTIYAKTQRQQDLWSSNVAALETLLQEQQKSKVAKATSVSKLPTRFKKQESAKKHDSEDLKAHSGKTEPLSRSRRTGLDATPTAAQELEARVSTAQLQAPTKAQKASPLRSKAHAPQGSVTSWQRSEVEASEAQEARLEAKSTSRHSDKSTLAPDDKLGSRIKCSAKAHPAMNTIVKKTGVQTENRSRLLEDPAKEMPKETSSRSKREAEKSLLPFPKRRALATGYIPLHENGKLPRPLLKSPDSPALKATRPLFPSPTMTAPLPDISRGPKMSEEISTVHLGGMSKIAQPEGDKSTQLDDVQLPNEGQKTDCMEYEKGMEAREPSRMVSQGTQTKSESDQAEAVMAKHIEADVFSRNTQTNPQLEQAEMSAIELDEAEVSSLGTPRTPEPYQAEKVLAWLKKIEQARHDKAKAAAEPERDYSVLTWMCSLLCFLMCLYILLQMALSTDYVAIRFGSFELVMRRS